MFEVVVRPEHADLCVSNRPPVVEIGANPSAMQIDRFEVVLVRSIASKLR
jgi:hypothetical protein